MIEAADVSEYTERKQEMQLLVEELFREQLALFDLRAFLADPRGYTAAFLDVAVAQAIRAVAGDAYRLGQSFGRKVGA